MAESCMNLKDTTAFHHFLCVRIEKDQFSCMNCWVKIHCLSVSCKQISHSPFALTIWSPLQLTSIQWIITQQFTARADLFLIQKVSNTALYFSYTKYTLSKVKKHILVLTKIWQFVGKDRLCTSVKTSTSSFPCVFSFSALPATNISLLCKSCSWS